MTASTAKARSGPNRSGEVARALIRPTKQASRRRFPAEEKPRILLEGIRAEISVSEVCRREGIHPTVDYTWRKDFMEAGKARMRGDNRREATTAEVRRRPAAGACRTGPRSLHVLSLYCRWPPQWGRQGVASLPDHRPTPDTAWTRLRPLEETRSRAEPLRQPDRSPQELACWLTDHAGFAVSESTVSRVLKRHGLLRLVTVRGVPAGPEYRGNPTRPNDPWQSDGSDVFVGAGTS